MNKKKDMHIDRIAKIFDTNDKLKEYPMFYDSKYDGILSTIFEYDIPHAIIKYKISSINENFTSFYYDVIILNDSRNREIVEKENLKVDYWNENARCRVSTYNDEDGDKYNLFAWTLGFIDMRIFKDRLLRGEYKEKNKTTDGCIFEYNNIHFDKIYKKYINSSK